MIPLRPRAFVNKLKQLNVELICWVSGLVYLAGTDPSHPHLSICPLKFLGFRYCPGCGLGRSVSYLLHGSLLLSLQTHPLGIFAFLVLIHRIFILSKYQYRLFFT